MNKLKRLRRRVIRAGAFAGVVVAAAAGAMLMTGSLAESALQKKNAATGQVSQDQARLEIGRAHV